MKIRTRFTLLFTLVVGVILCFFSFSIYYLSENYRIADFHARLQYRAITKLKLLVMTKWKFETLSFGKIEEENLRSLLNESIMIYDVNHTLLYRDTMSFAPTAQTINLIKNKKQYTYSKGNIEGIGFSYVHQGNTYILFASALDRYGTMYINNLKRILIVRGFIILLIIFISGWLYAGYFLKPISKIAQQASEITYSNLDKRLTIDNKDDEIGQLAATFNKVLERLETSFRIQKRFVSNASHELRNPLTAISGQIDVALMKERNNAEYKATLESILKDIKNLRTVSNNLLELANSEVETLFENFEELRIDEVLWSTRDEILHQKPEYNVHIHFEKIPDNEKEFTCLGRESLLKIAFSNIIDNACKFSSNKTVEIKVTLEKTNIILSFIDSGIGMPEHYLKHAFEPFYRGSNTHGIPGSGIGLSLVQRIIKLHSGKIFIRSKQNEGTTVELVFQNLS